MFGTVYFFCMQTRLCRFFLPMFSGILNVARKSILVYLDTQSEFNIQHHF
jgi:hypothetical protein